MVINGQIRNRGMFSLNLQQWASGSQNYLFKIRGPCASNLVIKLNYKSFCFCLLLVQAECVRCHPVPLASSRFSLFISIPIPSPLSLDFQPTASLLSISSFLFFFPHSVCLPLTLCASYRGYNALCQPGS